MSTCFTTHIYHEPLNLIVGERERGLGYHEYINTLVLGRAGKNVYGLSVMSLLAVAQQLQWP